MRSGKTPPIGRREFLAGSLGSLLAAGACARPAGAAPTASWGPNRKVLFAAFDGFGPEYLRESEMPNLQEMIQAGSHTEVTGVIPSLTNVNNASILTNSFPADHGITGNYYYDRSTDMGTFMESEEFLLLSLIHI